MSPIGHPLSIHQLAASTGPVNENVRRAAVGGSAVGDGDVTGDMSARTRALDEKLQRAKSAELRKLDRLADLSLSR